jgi:hypothetical protein
MWAQREMIKTLTMHNNDTTPRHIGVGLIHWVPSWGVILTLALHNNDTTPRHNRVGSMCLGVVSLLYSVSVLIISLSSQCVLVLCYWKMLDLQHQYNNCTTIPHMRVGPTYWGTPSCEGLLYSCCIGVVQESNLYAIVVHKECKDHSPGPKYSMVDLKRSCVKVVQELCNKYYS